MRRLVPAIAVLAAGLSPAFAHHASDETILEALVDHAMDNWAVTLGVAVALVAAGLWLRSRRKRARAR